MGYTKIFSSLLSSTVWVGSTAETKVVWIAMLVLADKNGEVQASIPGLAKQAEVSIEVVERALEKFLSPDPYSRTTTDEGRRIEAIDGGWLILNHEKYREMESYAEKIARRNLRQQAYRARKKNNALCSDVTHITGDNNVTPFSQADPDADTEEQVVSSPKLRTTKVPSLMHIVEETFDHWRSRTGHSDARLSEKRKRLITARLKEGFTLEQLKEAIDGNRASAFHQGENDRHTVYDSIELICRDTEHVEKFIQLAKEQTDGTIRRRPESKSSRNLRETAAFFEAARANYESNPTELLGARSTGTDARRLVKASEGLERSDAREDS